MPRDPKRICPVELAGHLDSRFRRWLHDPRKILAPYLAPGMRALDIGCGPGFFTLDMAYLVGKTGHVWAADIQPGMLDTLKSKIKGTELEDRIDLKLIEDGRFGGLDSFDFALAFYMVHEVPDQPAFFKEIHSVLNSGGLALIVEPPLHVSRQDFQATIRTAQEAGLIQADRPKMILSKAVLLKKG
ncbi:MAG: class I SAM-dependent methyltransferase [Syntrophaceae bacterium]